MSRFYEDDDDGNVKQFKCDADNLEVTVTIMMMMLMMTLMCKKLRMPFLYCLNAKAQELLQLAFHMWKVNTY